MTDEVFSDLDRALRFVERVDDQGGAIFMAVMEYAHRTRGHSWDEMRDGWDAVKRLLERADKRRKDINK